MRKQAGRKLRHTVTRSRYSLVSLDLVGLFAIWYKSIYGGRSPDYDRIE